MIEIGFSALVGIVLYFYSAKFHQMISLREGIGVLTPLVPQESPVSLQGKTFLTGLTGSGKTLSGLPQTEYKNHRLCIAVVG